MRWLSIPPALVGATRKRRQRFGIMSMPIRILVLSSTRKERDGIAEYTRQVFRPGFIKPDEVDVRIADITPAKMLATPFQKADIVHVQHEFFLFDRLVGMSAMLYYPWLWLWSKLLGFKIVTTIHSTYNVDALENALPHFRKFKWLFPPGRQYLRLHLILVSKLSDRIIILSKIGLENMRQVISARDLARKIRYTHLGNYATNIHPQRHGLLEKTFGIASTEKIFTLFGFAFPTKGYEYAIYAMDILVNQRRRKDARLVVVSGETGKGSFPGGGQGGTYIGYLKQLAAERHLEPHVIFTGYLANEDALLEEIFAETLCFVFPYLDRNFPSGAISTVIATGKPILVSAIRCFQEYANLPSFAEKDPLTLANQMQVFMDNPAAVAAAADITRSNAEKFDMRGIFSWHAALYAELLPASSCKPANQP